MRKILLLICCSFLFLFNSVYADAPKTWTFLIFMNGDNNLDSYTTENLRAMEQVGSNDQVNIVVQWASQSAGKTVRLLVKKGTDPDNVTSPIIQEMGQVDMGDYHSLQDFIEWGVKNYPAEHYFIDVWNHGSGWHRVKTAKNNIPHLFGDLSYDENTGHSIKTEELGQVMTYATKLIGHKVDVYGSDACLMAMAEVAAEMANSVNIFAGSQETEPGAGWSYGDLLSRWEATPNATPEQVAKILVDTYVKSYQGGFNGTAEVTFSAFDLAKLSAFNHAMADFSANIHALSSDKKTDVLNTARSVQRFAFHDYADLLDFIKKISNARITGINPDVLANLQKTASELIIANEVTTAYAKATGLSIWFPTNKSTYEKHSTRYAAMNFNADTHWGDALKELTEHT